MLKRILTAIPLILLVILALFFTSPHVFALLTGLIFLYGSFEWSRLLKFSRNQQIIYIVLTALVFIGAGFINALFLLGLSALWWIIALPVLFHFNRKQGQTSFIKYRYLWAAIGILVLVSTWLGFNVLRLTSLGRFVVLFNLLLVWASDSGAYFVGKFLGKHHLAPYISPKKTIEGVIGGMVAAALVSLGATYYIFGYSPQFFGKFVLLGLVASGACVIGDLFESMLKRIHNVKDSGAIFPGHGGLLDRIDGLLATTPFFTLGILWLILVG